MPARTILYVHSSAGRYGADNQLALIARGLDPERYRAVVVLPFEGELSETLRAAGTEVVVRDLAVLRRSLMTPRGLRSVARTARADGRELGALARSRGVSLVHSNTSVVLGGRAAARVAGVPHVWHVREIYDGVRGWPLYRRVLERADALACVSSAVARQFPGSGAARVIGDGVQAPALPPRAQARSALGLGEDVFTVAVLGRISDWKGQDVLLDALAAPGLENAVALLAGSAWPGEERHERALRDRAERVGVTGRVHFLGHRDDPETVYAAADVVAVPSTRPDPLPNTALEAAAAGRPVVASHLGGLPEIVRDRETGLLVTPDDAGALARALTRLSDDPALGERLGGAARADVCERYSPARLLAALQSLYDELLTARAR